jgi:hypothetical protein
MLTEDADDFVRHAIARTIIALAKAGERNCRHPAVVYFRRPARRLAALAGGIS